MEEVLEQMPNWKVKLETLLTDELTKNEKDGLYYMVNDMIMKKVVVLLIIGLITTMSAAAQSDNWVPDSIDVDSIIIDQREKDDIVKVEWDKRYGVVEKDGKWALYDFKGDSLLTGFVYDEAGPAYRKRVFGDYITYFYIKENGRI